MGAPANGRVPVSHVAAAPPQAAPGAVVRMSVTVSA
jgi:hypothetical protein